MPAPCESPVQMGSEASSHWLWRYVLESIRLRFFYFCLHLPLISTLTCLVAIATRVIGDSFGVWQLLTHEDAARQFVGGIFVAFGVGECLLLGWAFDSRRPQMAMADGGQALSAAALALNFLSYAGSIVLSFMVTASAIGGVFMLLKMVVRRNLVELTYVDYETADASFAALFWIGGLSGLGVVVVAAAIPGTRLLRPRLGPCADRLRSRIDGLRADGLLRPGPPLTPKLLQTFVAPFVLLVLVLVCFVSARASGSAYSPAVIGFFFVYVLLGLYGMLYYVHPRLVPAVVLAMLVILGFGGIPMHKYRIPEMDDCYKEPQLPYSKPRPIKADSKSAYAAEDPREKAPNPDLIEIGEVAFRDEAERKAKTKKPMVVVVASGGGLRAAAWTFAMLEKLETALRCDDDKDIYLPRHLRLITGASGGMLGAAYYTATVPDPGLRKSVDAVASKKCFEGQYEKLTKDCLTPILDEMLISDFAACFSPWIQTKDRGRELEKAWRDNLDGALDVPFQSLKAGERAGWRPSIVFSPMMIEDGRRLLISNLDLHRVVRNAGNVIDKENETYSYEGIEFFRRFSQAPLKLSTAARLSASFPFFSPAVTLPTWPRRRVVDAGYYDNYGVSLAASYLFSSNNREWILENTNGILLIQIRDGLSQAEREMQNIAWHRPPNQLALAVEEFTSPLQGVLSARVATASYRNDGMLEMLSQHFKEVERDDTKSDTPFFTTATFEYPGRASLNWYLTRSERANIRGAALLPPIDNWPKPSSSKTQDDEKIREDIAGIKKWWRSRGGPTSYKK
jgi:hypothetical protein